MREVEMTRPLQNSHSRRLRRKQTSGGARRPERVGAVARPNITMPQVLERDHEARCSSGGVLSAHWSGHLERPWTATDLTRCRPHDHWSDDTEPLAFSSRAKVPERVHGAAELTRSHT